MDLAFSGITDKGYFLISACKGMELGSLFSDLNIFK